MAKESDVVGPVLSSASSKGVPRRDRDRSGAEKPLEVPGGAPKTPGRRRPEQARKANPAM